MHDLAQSFPEEICSIIDDNDVQSTYERICHLSIYQRKALKDINSVQLPTV